MAGPDDSTWDGIFAKNPVPKDDPRHDEVVDDLLRVKEQLDLFDSGALDKRPPEEAPVEQHVAYLVDLQVGRFDIHMLVDIHLYNLIYCNNLKRTEAANFEVHINPSMHVVGIPMGIPKWGGLNPATRQIP
jgi:hypothetical protein